ncbi:MAG: hypothetical protein JRJ45_00265 [Deltaproteobacteria bacterium]|nr:hypothetical protein [Deltaproteobacteria bacterium]
MNILETITSEYTKSNNEDFILNISIRNQDFINENNKLLTGEYSIIPNCVYTVLSQYGITIDDSHILHCSKKQPGKIAYTPDYGYLLNNRQVRSSLSKYLTKYNPTIAIPSHVLSVLVGMIKQSAYGLSFASTPFELMSIYNDTSHISSCMSYSVDSYQTDNIHPVSVYSYPNNGVSLAYIKNDNNEVISRAIVRNNNGILEFNRCYGDIDLMKAKLLNQGYVYNVKYMEGARLALVKTNSGRIICPFIDMYDNGQAGQWGVTIDEWHNCLIVGRHGDCLSSDYQTGLLESDNDDDQVTCDCCSDLVDSDNTTSVDYSVVCDDCLESYFIYCENVDHYVNENDDELEYTESGEPVYSFNIMGYSGYIRIANGEIISEDDAVLVDSSGEYERVDDCTYCDDAGAWELSENTVYSNDMESHILYNDAESYIDKYGDKQHTTDLDYLNSLVDIDDVYHTPDNPDAIVYLLECEAENV